MSVQPFEADRLGPIAYALTEVNCDGGTPLMHFVVSERDGARAKLAPAAKLLEVASRVNQLAYAVRYNEPMGETVRAGDIIEAAMGTKVFEWGKRSRTDALATLRLVHYNCVEAMDQIDTEDARALAGLFSWGLAVAVGMLKDGAL